MPSPILVTGASGNVGSAVVRSLLELDHPVRCGDRDQTATERLFPDADHIRLDFDDPSTFGPACDGVERLFLIRPPAVARVGPTLNRLVDVAAEGSVDHVVFSSVAGAESNRVVPHHRVEQHLMQSGMGWTMLRPGFFAQNITGAYRRDIVDDDRIYVPAGDGKIAFVDTADLGAAAAIVLTSDGHRGKSYHLTGPRAVTFNEVAAMLTSELGRPVRYEPASVFGYARHLKRSGLPVVQVVVQTVLHTGLRRGDAEEVTDDLDRLLSRPPRSLEQFIADAKPVFTSP